MYKVELGLQETLLECLPVSDRLSRLVRVLLMPTVTSGYDAKHYTTRVLPCILGMTES